MTHAFVRHVPDTQAAINAVAAKLKPGAPFLVYLYYALDNRPAWYRALWRLSNLGRLIISRLPHRLRFVVSQTIAKRYFPTGNAIGHSLKIDSDTVPGPWQIVGIARDTKSGDPRDTPQVDFRYFQEGTEDGGEDLESVVDGVRFVRKLTESLQRNGYIAKEELPGDDVQSDEQLRDYIRYNAWGHHASCSCAIGPREQNGVLDSRFRVHGTTGLRVVDASVFPRIPGFFIVSAVYMIGEKAADVILADLKRSGQSYH